MKLKGVVLEDLETFLAISTAGSFRRAAERIGTSQPTVTLRLQRLEHALGLKLLSRTTRGVSLTEAGARMLPRFEAAISELGAAVQQAHDEASLKQGSVSMGVSPTIVAGLLLPILKDFMGVHPQVQVHLSDDYRTPLLERLLSGALDFVIVPFDQDTAEFRCEHLFVEDLVFVAPLSFGLDAGKAYAFGELCHLPFVTISRPSAIWSTLADTFESANMPFRPVIEVNTVLPLIRMVESGMGLTLLPGSLISQKLLGNVMTLKMHDLHKARQMSLVTVQGRTLSPAATSFCRILKNAVKRPRAARAVA